MAAATTRSENAGSATRRGVALASAVVTGLLVVLAVSCSGSSDSESAPPSARGAELYQANCASCHGTDLRGTDTGPSHLSVVYEPNHHGDGAFLFAVLRGVQAHHWPFGDMAPVEGLTPEDVGAIVAFVREQQRVNGFEPYPP